MLSNSHKKGAIVDHQQNALLIDATIMKKNLPNESRTWGKPNVKYSGCEGQSRKKLSKNSKETWIVNSHEILATNTLSVPQVSFTFGIVKWNLDELKQLDTYTRKIMKTRISNYTRASVPRIPHGTKEEED